MTVSGSTFTDNTATTGQGGGIIAGGTLTVKGSSFTNNSANSSGGGSSFGGGIYSDATLTVDHSIISGNSATTGGGLYVSGGSQAEIDFSTINDPSGGGIVNKGSTVHLKKTVVDGVLYKDQYYV